MERMLGSLLEASSYALQVLYNAEKNISIQVLRTQILNIKYILHKTGTEAMFADLGHFNVMAVQVHIYHLFEISGMYMQDVRLILPLHNINGNSSYFQISFSFTLFPAVSLAYIGQAAFLRKHPEHVLDTFYRSIPGKLFRMMNMMLLNFRTLWSSKKKHC